MGIKKQKVGDSIIAENANWSFAGNVSKTFDSHVSKSVPFYREGHDLIAKISDFFLNDDSICYDLGCSTGELVRTLVNRNKNKTVKFIAIDREDGMLEAARKKNKELKNVVVVKSDLVDVDFEKADLIVSYYTMQFVRPKNRQILFDRIFNALNWGGGFLLFEKVRAPDARFQDMMSAIYTDYKLDNGYNSEEIIAKSRSLKGVLEPFSTQGNLDLLKRAGFVDIMTIMKFISFEGFLAIK
jgi:tRNA (cmo5U34)-methyltransferase